MPIYLPIIIHYALVDTDTVPKRFVKYISLYRYNIDQFQYIKTHFRKKVSQHLDLRSVLIYSVFMGLASVTSVGDGVCERNWTTSASKACIGIRQEYIAHGDIFF